MYICAEYWMTLFSVLSTDKVLTARKQVQNMLVSVIWKLEVGACI